MMAGADWFCDGLEGGCGASVSGLRGLMVDAFPFLALRAPKASALDVCE